MRSLQSRGVVLRPSVHKQILQLAADTGDPVRAGQAVSAIRRSGQRLSATAFSRYIVANAKSRVSLSVCGGVAYLVTMVAYRDGPGAI